MKIAWPCPAFIVVKHIAHVFFEEDMLMDLGNRRPEDDGVGVVGLGTVTGESETASLDLLEREEDSSSVLGT